MTVKQQEERDELMDMLPDLPSDWNEWIESTFTPSPIFYRNEGHGVFSCTCGKCGEEYALYTRKENDFEIPAEKPVKGEEAVCPYCKNVAAYMQKRCTAPRHEGHEVAIYQRAGDMLISRIFYVHKRVHQGYEQDIRVTEEIRTFYTPGQVKQYARKYEWEQGKGGYQWKKVKGWGGYNIYWIKEYDSIGIIKDTTMKYSGAEEKGNAFARIERLKAYCNNPGIEYYEKMGMSQLVRQLEDSEGISKLINRKATDIKKQLRLKEKRHIQRLIEDYGNINTLRILQMFEKRKMKLNDKDETFVLELGTRAEDFIKAAEFSTVKKAINYIKKQKCYENRDWSKVSHYIDYINNRKELGYDMTNSVYIFPKNLKEKHDEMVRIKRERADDLYIARKNREYERIEANYEKLNQKLYRKHRGLYIRPAKSAEEIIQEGRLQHHCVGGDNYLRKHNNKESVILLLRHREVPFYTIELSKDLEVLQFYAAHDKQPHYDYVKDWLDNYVEELKAAKVKI